MFNFLKTLVSPITTLGSQYLKNRAAIKDAEASLVVKRLEAKARLMEQESAQAHDLDSKAADERRTSLKDEAITYTVLALIWVTAASPFVGAQFQERVREMWRMLKEEVPQEFWIFFGLLFVAVFGFRRLLSKWLDARGGLFKKE